MMAATVASPTRPGQEPLAMNDIITTPNIKASPAGDDHRAQARRVCRCRLYERCSGGQGDERERYGPQIGLPAVVHDGAGGVRRPRLPEIQRGE